MYAYIFDSFLQDRKYQHDIGQIENRLATLGIQGKMEKMTILKNFQEAAKQAIKRGADTLVAVGNDETVTKILPQLIEANVTLGLIPLGPNQTIAKVFGLPVGVNACDALSRRIVRKIDVGQANTNYFVFSLVTPPGLVADCGKYSITSLDPTGTMTIANFPIAEAHGSPDDGKLELIVAPGEQRGWGSFKRGTSGSVFPISHAKLTSPGAPASVMLDGQITVKTPITIEVAKKKLTVIVGKGREF